MEGVSKAAMQLFLDLDFLNMRIEQQDAYIAQLKLRQNHKRYPEYSRLQELIEGARERKAYFEQIKRLVEEGTQKKQTTAP